MTNQLLLILGATVLLGAALLWAMRSDRRRQIVQQRLQTVTAAERSGDDDPATRVSLLRRTLAQARPGVLHQLPADLWDRLDSAFAAAGNRIGLSHLVAAAGVAAAVMIGFASGVMQFGSGVVLLLGAIAVVAAPFFLLRWAQMRFQRRFLDVFPDALDLIVRAVKAGLPVTEATEVASREIADPVGSELRQALEQVRIGVEMGDALQEMADRIRVPDFRFYVVALALQQRSGGSLADTLNNLSGTIRARKTLRLKARALSAEAKASAVVLAVLPFIVGGLMVFLNRDLASALFTDPRGRFMMGIALLSLLTGLGVMAEIVRRSLR